MIVEILADEDGGHQTRERIQTLTKYILEVSNLGISEYVREQWNEEF